MLVLDNGQLAEAGHPHELLTTDNKYSVFAELVAKTGAVTAKTLRELAKGHWEAQKQAVNDVANKDVQTRNNAAFTNGASAEGIMQATE